MAENNELAIQVGVVLNTEDIGKQLAAIENNKDSKIKVKVTADTDEAKKKINELKDDLKNSKSPAKIAIDVLKGQSNTNIGNYVKEIQEKYQTSPIKITLDIDKNATTANINKAVGDIQQQVQKAVDQATKSAGNAATTNVGSGASGIPGVDSTQLKNTISDLEEIEGITKRISTGIMTEGGFKPGSVVDEFRDFNGTLGETLKVYRQLNKEQTELAGQNMLDEVSRTYETNYKTVSDYISRIETEFNKLYSGAFEGKNPLEGLYAKEAESALNAYRTEIEQIKSSGETITVEQQARIQQLHDYAQKVIEDQKRQATEVRAYYNDLNKEYRQSEKQKSSDQQMYDKMLAQREQEFQKLADQMDKYNATFNKMYSDAFEQKNPLTGEFADKALDALQKYQDEYQNVMKAGTVATDEQKRKIEELHQAAVIAIKEQQSLQQQYNSDKRQDYSGLFGQSKEWEAALKQITDAENKLNEIQKNAFSGTNALTGDFAKEATRQIDEVKNKFAEIRKTAEESFGGAATVSKDALKKMVDDLKSDLDRLAKLEYPSDKLAAQNVDVKKAFAADALAEMEERLKSLGDSTTEYYNKVQDLKTILSTVGQVDSDPSAWAKFRNEFHMLEDEIKKFEASAQGMGQKLAAGLENNQLQQIAEMVNRLNNIDEKFNGAGVERLQQSLQSLAQEYMNVIEQLQNPNLSKDEYDALANKVRELSDQFKQAQNAVKIFNDGFKNEGDLKKYEQSADALRMRFEQLQKTYANLANKNPEIADRFREVENAINGMDPKNIGEVTRQVGNLAKECGNASGQSAGLRGALQDAFGGLGSYLARFASSYYLISKTIQGVKKMVNAVKEVDTSLVELQKVTTLTGDSLTQFTDKAYQMGAQLGRTGKDVIDAATTFSRAGYDLNEATQLAQSALVMTNVGVDIPNIESAASDMISILKAFDIQVEESMDVIDKLYNVANKEPLDFGNITEMLVTAGGTLAQSGSSIEETMGLLTGAFATMRNTSVANGLLMISQRLRGLSEDGEAIDGLIPKLQSLFGSVGISIEDQNGELRSTFDILQDLAGVWDQLSSKQKQFFGEKVAGNRQVKTLNAIMQNWNVVADTVDKANNAQGEALKGNEMYMNSIKGRITQLQSAFQELARNTINSDFVKSIVSAGTEIVKLISNIGGLGPVLTTIIGLITTIKGKKIADGIKNIWSAFSTLFKGMTSGLTATTGWVGAFIALVGIIAAVKTGIDNAHNSLKKFEEAKEKYNEHTENVNKLNEELKNTQERIEELNAKDSLTIIEQKELDNLKETNDELLKQIKYEEELARIAKQSEKEAAVKAFDDEMDSQHSGGFFGEDVHYSKAAEDALGFDYLKGQTAMQMDYGTGVAIVEQLRPTEIERVNADLAALTIHLNELKDVNEKLKNPDLSEESFGQLSKRKEELNNFIDETVAELGRFNTKLVEKTDGFDYVENATKDSIDDRMNKMLDLRKQIESAVADANDRNLSKTDIFKNIIEEYSDAVSKIKSKSEELGDSFKIAVPDSVKQDMKQTQDQLIEQVEGILAIFDRFDDKDIHKSLGEILTEQLDIGNVNGLTRKIKHDSDLVAAGWMEAYEGMEEAIATFYSVSDFEFKDLNKDIQYAITATPIDANGNVLSPDELNEYLYGLIEDATDIDDLMAKDAEQKGLILHYTPTMDMSPEALEDAFAKEVNWSEVLHSLSAAFEQALLAEKTNGTDESQSVIDYLKGIINAAIEDPSYTSEALTEFYTVIQALGTKLAEEGDDALNNALSEVNIPESISEALGLSNMSADDFGAIHFDELIIELMTKLGLTYDEAVQSLEEYIGNNQPEIEVKPRFNVNIDELGVLFQTTDSYTKVLTKAMSEQEKAGTLTAETIQKLLSDQGLPGIRDCLVRTAEGYALNTEAVRQYINAQNEDIRLNALAGIMERQLAIEDLTNATYDATDAQYELTEAEWEADREETIAQLEDEVTQLEMVADQAYEAADALEAMRQASKTANEDANHTEAQKMLEGASDLYDVGKIGTDDFKSAMNYLLGEGWLESFNNDLEAAFKVFKSKKERYFAEDDADSAINFMKDLDTAGFAEYDEATGSLKLLENEATGAIYTLEEISEAFGISKEAARDLFELINSYIYGDENKITFEETIDSAEKLAVAQKKLEELAQQRAEAEQELNKLREENADNTAIEEQKNKVEELAKEEENLASAVETAQEALEKGTEPLTLDEALKKIEELQSAIDTFNKDYKITPIVELTDEYKSLEKMITGGNAEEDGTVHIVVGGVADAEEKLANLKENLQYIKDNPNLPTEVKASLVDQTELGITALEEYIKTYSSQPNKAEKSANLTITADGESAILTVETIDSKIEETQQKTEENPLKISVNDEANSKIEQIEIRLSKLEEEPTEATVEVEEDTTKNTDAVKDDVENTFKNPIPAVIKAVSSGIKTVSDALDAVAKKERKAIIKASIELNKPVNTTSRGTPTEKDVQDSVNKTSTTIGARKNNQGVYNYVDPAQELAKIKEQYKQIYGQIPDNNQFKTAINNLLANGVLVLQDSVTENLDEWINKANEVYNRDYLEGLNAETEVPPIVFPTEVDKELLKQQMEGVVDDVNPSPEVEVGGNCEGIEEDVEEAVSEIPEQEVQSDLNTDGYESKVAGTIATMKVPEVQAEVKTVTRATDAYNYKPKDLTQNVNIKGDNSGAVSSVQGVKTEANKGATMPINADTKSAESSVDALDRHIETGKTKPVYINFGNIINTLVSWENRIAQAVYKTVYITYKETNQYPQHAKGTKRAKDGMALVDEKGAELIEHPKQGTFELGTNNGARLTHLDSGDIVHTAEETKKILARLSGLGGLVKGSIGSLGTLIGDAFATGVRGGGVARPKRKKKDDSTSRSRSSRSSRGSSRGSSSRGSSSYSSPDTYSSSESDPQSEELKAWTDRVSYFFDWVEIKLKRIKDVTSEFVAESQRAISLWSKNNKIASAMSSIHEEISNTNRAYLEYMGMADYVGRLSGLSEYELQRVREGDISVGLNYDKATQEKIKEYQKWYEKALECKKALGELEDQEKELAKQSLQNIVNEYEGQAKLYDLQKGTYSAEREYKKSAGKAVTGASYKNKYFTGSYGDYSADINAESAKQAAIVKEREDLQKQLNSLLSSGTIQIGDDVWKEYTEKLENLNAEIYKSKQAIEALKDEAVSLTFSQISYDLDSLTTTADRINKTFEYGTARGSTSRAGKANYYNKLINNAKEQNKNLEKQNALYNDLRSGLDVTSEKYQEYTKKIEENKLAILENKKTMEEYKKSIAQLGIDKYAYQVEKLTDQADKYNDKMNKNALLGVAISKRSYEQLITNANSQINYLNKQKNAYEELMRALVNQYGEAAKTSDLYITYEQTVRSLDSSIRDLEASTIQWSRDIENVPIQKLGWQLDKLKESANKLSDKMSLNDARGVENSESYYSKLISNAEEQNDVLNRQIKRLAAQQKGMDFNSQAYQDLQDSIDQNKRTINANLISIEKWKDAMAELPIERLNHKLDQLNNNLDIYKDTINQMELEGKRITKEYYEKMIANGENEIDNLKSQKDAYQQLMNELVNTYGKAAKESDVYKEYEKSLNSVDSQIRSVTASMREWQIEVENIPINELNWDLDELNRKLDTLNGLKELNDVQGVETAVEMYSDLINNGLERIALLEEENKLLEERQKWMDSNSESFQEIEQQIAANNKEIWSIKTAQEEWNDSIVDIGINNIQKYKDSLSKSNEQLDRQKELYEAIQNLEKANTQRKVRTYVEGEGFVYRADENEIKNAQEKLEDVIRNQLLNKMDDLIEALEESKKDTNIYDRYGNLIGTQYNTPQLGNLSDLLKRHYQGNSSANLDIGLLKEALGSNIISNVSPQNSNTTFSIGDIIVNEADNGNDLAKAIVDQFPNALLQALYSKQ